MSTPRTAVAALSLILAWPQLLQVEAGQTSSQGQTAGQAPPPMILRRFNALPLEIRLVTGSFLRSHTADAEWLIRETAALDASALRGASRSLRPRCAPAYNETLAAESARDFRGKAAGPRNSEKRLDVAHRLALLQAVLPPFLNKDERAALARVSWLSREKLLDKAGRQRLDELMRQMTLALSPSLEEKSLEAREPSDTRDLEMIVRTLYNRKAPPGEPLKAGGPVDRLGQNQLEGLRLLAAKPSMRSRSRSLEKKLEAVKEHLLTLTQLALLTSPGRDHKARGILLDAIKALEPKLSAAPREFRLALETLERHASAPVELVYDQARRRYVDGRAWIARELLARFKK